MENFNSQLIRMQKNLKLRNVCREALTKECTYGVEFVRFNRILSGKSGFLFPRKKGMSNLNDFVKSSRGKARKVLLMLRIRHTPDKLRICHTRRMPGIFYEVISIEFRIS